MRNDKLLPIILFLSFIGGVSVIAQHVRVNGVSSGAGSAATTLALANNVYITGRNAGNSANINMFRINGTDTIDVGAQLEAGIINASSVAAGSILGTGGVSSAAAGFLGFTGRSYLTSSGSGLLNVNNNAGTIVSYQMNVGTAAPTVTTCGTGTVTAHSNNTGGQITATGATVCTVTFGAPAWTFTPFCQVTDGTGARALWISGATTTAFTVNGLTSGDVFTYHCDGGGI